MAAPALGFLLGGRQRFGRPRGGPLFGQPDGDGPGPAASLPPGTYGELRDAQGQTLRRTELTFGAPSLPLPKLPRDLPPDRPLTVGAVSGGLRYRVRSTAEPGGDRSVVVAIPLSGVDASLRRLLVDMALVIAGVLAVLGLAAFVLVRAGLRPLERMGHTAGAIAAGDLSRRVDECDPRTEVGRLGLALNGMLARLEEAFAERSRSESRLRQFLSDASHELRTPLAAIRGYAELYRMGATPSEADRAKAMRRIEEEAARMGVLVEDLLVLARLDEVREPVREPVDLRDLAADAVADARATAPGRAIDAHLDGEATVLGDPDQLRQVLSNLVRNALVHTPGDARIDVTARRTDTVVELEVRDTGPGLPPGDPDAIFGRFWRAERGRARGRAGAGLGLAIVQGIVAAHGGEVRAANDPAGGVVFTARLPVA